MGKMKKIPWRRSMEAEKSVAGHFHNQTMIINKLKLETKYIRTSRGVLDNQPETS
jgi:hypothetical protein